MSWWAATLAVGWSTVGAGVTAAQETASVAAHRAPEDFDVIKSRLVQLAPEERLYDLDRLHRLMRDQREDGSWPGIDYADRTASQWATNYHLVILRHLATAFWRADHPLHGEERLRQVILRGFDYWIGHDFQNPNWWWNEVATPGSFSRLLLLLEPELTPEQKAAGLRLCERELAKGGRTGQNTVWTAQVAIALGALQEDPVRVEWGFHRITDEVRVGLEDGKIQPDWSFNQHAVVIEGIIHPQLYSGGYGKEFAKQCARFARLADGTRFAWPAEKIDLLVNLLLEGDAWMCRGRVFDYGACGRDIARENCVGSDLAEACDDLVAIGVPRQAELQAFAARLRGGDPDAGAPVGSRYFWRGELMTHHRPG